MNVFNAGLHKYTKPYLSIYMSAILSDSFRVESAKILQDSIVNSTPTYMFIGKSTEWPSGNTVNPSDSKVSQSDAMNDLIVGKRLGDD